MSHHSNTSTYKHDPEKGIAGSIYPRDQYLTLPTSHGPQLPPLNFHDGDEEPRRLESFQPAGRPRMLRGPSISHPKPALTRPGLYTDLKIPVNEKPSQSITVPARNEKEGSGTRTKPKKRANRWIRYQLWYNTYRSVGLFKKERLPDFANYFHRKFFTVVVCLNFVGILLAALGKWEYPRIRTGALVLGNLQMAILVRNELFGRLLYLVLNTLFAKVGFTTRPNTQC